MASTEPVIRARIEFPVPPVLMKERSRSTSRPCLANTCLAMMVVAEVTPLTATRFLLRSFKLFNSGLLRIQLRTLSFVARMTLRGAPSLGNADKPHGPRHTELKATRNHGLDTQF